MISARAGVSTEFERRRFFKNPGRPTYLLGQETTEDDMDALKTADGPTEFAIVGVVIGPIVALLAMMVAAAL